MHGLGDALGEGGALAGEFMIEYGSIHLITPMSHSIHEQVSSQLNEESLIEASQNQQGAIILTLISDMLMRPHLPGTVLLTLVVTAEHFHNVSNFSWTNDLTLVTLSIVDSRLSGHQQVVEAVLHVASFNINARLSTGQFEGSVSERVADIIMHSILIAHRLLFIGYSIPLNGAKMFHSGSDKSAAELND